MKRHIFTARHLSTIYITTEFDYAKRDSRLVVYGGDVLQRFKFIKFCMGKTGNRHYG